MSKRYYHDKLADSYWLSADSLKGMINYKKLNIWRKEIELVKLTYQLAEKLPKEEKYGMISQMTRVSVSIPANIAERSSRNSEKDYVRFLQIALGSAFELETYFVIGKEMNWINIDGKTGIEKLLEEEIKMIQSFIKLLLNSYKPTANSQKLT